jgi:hypothetical protein
MGIVIVQTARIFSPFGLSVGGGFPLRLVRISVWTGFYIRSLLQMVKALVAQIKNEVLHLIVRICLGDI